MAWPNLSRAVLRSPDSAAITPCSSRALDCSNCAWGKTPSVPGREPGEGRCAIGSKKQKPSQALETWVRTYWAEIWITWVRYSIWGMGPEVTKAESWYCLSHKKIWEGDLGWFPIIKRIKLTAAKLLAQGHTVCKLHTSNSNPGLSGSLARLYFVLLYYLQHKVHSLWKDQLSAWLVIVCNIECLLRLEPFTGAMPCPLPLWDGILF